jgi:putative ATPase
MTRPSLSERMRPDQLDGIRGLDRWIGPGAPLRRTLDAGRLGSTLLWGPPGCGKTTLARALARHVGARMYPLSAVSEGIKALREVIDQAERPLLGGHPPVVFVDEIHRWNKAQQDALLPHLESGLLVLVGATTENPSFAVNAALRSRLTVLRLEPVPASDLEGLLEKALRAPQGLNRPDLRVEDGLLRDLATACAGDARRALDDLERLVLALPPDAPLTAAHAELAITRSDLRHDRSGDDHHDVTSALIKSLRGSDADAALYWLARMISGGEDPMFIARRLVIFASEDVGNADPRALSVAVDAARAVELVGMPEGRIPLAQATTWLACCPKSNASYVAIGEALAEVERTGALPVPIHLRQSPGASAWHVGGKSSYKNPHDAPHHIVEQRYLPEGMAEKRWYRPVDHGEEKTIRARQAWWAERLSKR